jgi:hypothetical protein
MDMHRRFWLGLIGAIAGMGIITSCSSLIPMPKATMQPLVTASLAVPAPLPSATLSSATLPPVMLPPSGGPPTVAPLTTSSIQPPAGQEALPGLTGKWIDPDSVNGDTVSTIAWQNGTYVVISVINSSRGVNEVTKSSWLNGVLTWVYCPASYYCITQTTISLNGNALTVNWSRTDVQSSGTSVLQRQP